MDIAVVSILVLILRLHSGIWLLAAFAEEAKRMPIGALPAKAFCPLTAGFLVALGSANAAWAQEQLPPPQPAQAAPPAKPADPIETPSPSQVVPQGGFPTVPAASQGGSPPGIARPRPGPLDPAIPPPRSDYAPPGFYPRGIQELPGVPEFYRPVSGPLPYYYYQPGYYERPVVGPHSV